MSIHMSTLDLFASEEFLSPQLGPLLLPEAHHFVISLGLKYINRTELDFSHHSTCLT